MDLSSTKAFPQYDSAPEMTEIVALQRSGHHAFIAWLCGWKSRPTLFINNVLPYDASHYGQLITYHEDQINHKSLSEYKHDSSLVLMQNEHDIMMNFEGRSTKNIKKFNSGLSQYIEKKNFRCILFLRDPLNNFSSLTKKNAKSIYKKYLNAFYQVSRFCDYVADLQKSNAGSGKLFHETILFTPWQLDENYRRILATKFGLDGIDLKRSVSAFGGGSSFQGVGFDPLKDQQNLFTRWKEMRHDPFFLSLFLSDRVMHAIEVYYSMFGAVETEGMLTVRDLRGAAERNPEAVQYHWIWIETFESSREIFDAAERNKIRFVRRFLRACIKAKTTTRLLFYRPQ
jgi:hypothetical protein